ncbi:hypothetical protein FRC03_003837 [Tulasnella sp. 419]|nr:hypothetical protein FRC03_003837 [Tulasnella sp. 419]
MQRYDLKLDLPYIVKKYLGVIGKLMTSEGLGIRFNHVYMVLQILIAAPDKLTREMCEQYLVSQLARGELQLIIQGLGDLVTENPQTATIKVDQAFSEWLSSEQALKECGFNLSPNVGHAELSVLLLKNLANHACISSHSLNLSPATKYAILYVADHLTSAEGGFDGYLTKKLILFRDNRQLVKFYASFYKDAEKLPGWNKEEVQHAAEGFNRLFMD